MRPKMAQGLPVTWERRSLFASIFFSSTYTSMGILDCIYFFRMRHMRQDFRE